MKTSDIIGASSPRSGQHSGYLKTGTIDLKRESAKFTAGFCLLNGSLPGLQAQVSLLHPKEKVYYDSLRFEKRKASFLLGRIAAKYAVAELTNSVGLNDILVDSGVFQFPVIKYPGARNIQVSISHCDNWGIALAFPEEHPLGVDLEGVNGKNMEALENQITDQEKRLLERLPHSKEVGYTMLWTIKEGLSKILRTGLTMDFRLLAVNCLKPAGPIIESTYLNSIQYKALSLPGHNYVLSVVLPRKTSPDLDEFWNSCLSSNEF